MWKETLIMKKVSNRTKRKKMHEKKIPGITLKINISRPCLSLNYHNSWKMSTLRNKACKNKTNIHVITNVCTL